MRGRKPKPTSLRLLEGNPSKRALPKNEARPRRADSYPPPHSLSTEAREQWTRIAPQLLEAGLLTELDTFALELLCVVLARWQEANRHIAADGMVVLNSRGRQTQSPYLRIASTCFNQIRAMHSEFGLTPSSRSRIDLSNRPSGEDNPFSRFGKR